MKELFKSKFVLATATVAAVFTAGLIGFNSVGAGFVADCDPNAIMKCGAPSPTKFISNAKTDKPGDLKMIYSWYGMTPEEYGRFVKTARPGELYRDGRAVVDGQVVGTASETLGRNPRSHQKVIKIPGAPDKYYQSKTQYSFASGVKSLPIMVMFTPHGAAEFAVINACGNPIEFSQKTPKYSCDKLHKSAVTGKANTYQFWTDATAKNNAVVTKLVYNFGDGKTKTIATKNPNTKVTHTYAKPGDYKVTVQVYVQIPGKQTKKTAISEACSTTVTIAKPFQQCLAISAKIVKPEDRSYEITVTTKQGNGSELKSANFDFGDGKTAVDVARTTESSVVTTHAYDKAADYTIKATVNFTTAYGVESVACQTSLSIAEKTVPPKPVVVKPVASVTPLPKTGIGSVAGIFAGTSIASGLGYHFLSRRRARN